MPNTQTEEELRIEFFDGPASDSMSFEQFLMRKGRGDLIPDKPVKRSKGSPKGGEVAKKTVKNFEDKYRKKRPGRPKKKS